MINIQDKFRDIDKHITTHVLYSIVNHDLGEDCSALCSLKYKINDSFYFDINNSKIGPLLQKGTNLINEAQNYEIKNLQKCFHLQEKYLKENLEIDREIKMVKIKTNLKQKNQYYENKIENLRLKELLLIQNHTQFSIIFQFLKDLTKLNSEEKVLYLFWVETLLNNKKIEKNPFNPFKTEIFSFNLYYLFFFKNFFFFFFNYL